MTDGDRKFLARLVASHKAVIGEECARKKLDRGEYLRRTAKADRKAQNIEFSRRPHRF